MRAVVFKSPREVVVEDVPDATAEQDDDVVVRVTSSALCGTDLHMYDGRTGASPGARLRGASEVYSVDLIDERLDKAAELGFVPVDARQGDPAGQIRELRRARAGGTPAGEEEMGGVMAGIDAVGFQARDRRHPDREDPRQVIGDLARKSGVVS